jgi:hypothetical protein
MVVCKIKRTSTPWGVDVVEYCQQQPRRAGAHRWLDQERSGVPKEEYDVHEYDVYGKEVFVHTAGEMQKDNPGKPMGLITIATAIPDMGALTSLDLTSNCISADDLGPIIALLKENVIEQG